MRTPHKFPSMLKPAVNSDLIEFRPEWSFREIERYDASIALEFLWQICEDYDLDSRLSEEKTSNIDSGADEIRQYWPNSSISQNAEYLDSRN